MQGYCRAGDITQEELGLISKIAKQPKSTSDTHLQNVRIGMDGRND